MIFFLVALFRFKKLLLFFWETSQFTLIDFFGGFVIPLSLNFELCHLRPHQTIFVALNWFLFAQVWALSRNFFRNFFSPQHYLLNENSQNLLSEVDSEDLRSSKDENLPRKFQPRKWILRSSFRSGSGPAAHPSHVSCVLSSSINRRRLHTNTLTLTCESSWWIDITTTVNAVPKCPFYRMYVTLLERIFTHKKKIPAKTSSSSSQFTGIFLEILPLRFTFILKSALSSLHSFYAFISSFVPCCAPPDPWIEHSTHTNPHDDDGPKLSSGWMRLTLQREFRVESVLRLWTRRCWQFFFSFASFLCTLFSLSRHLFPPSFFHTHTVRNGHHYMGTGSGVTLGCRSRFRLVVTLKDCVFA